MLIWIFGVLIAIPLMEWMESTADALRRDINVSKNLILRVYVMAVTGCNNRLACFLSRIDHALQHFNQAFFIRNFIGI